MFYYAHVNVTEKHVFRGSVHLNSILDILIFNLNSILDILIF